MITRIFIIFFLIALPLSAQDNDCSAKLASINAALGEEEVNDGEIKKSYRDLLNLAKLSELRKIIKILESGSLNIRSLTQPLHDAELKKGLKTAIGIVNSKREKPEHIELLKSAIQSLIKTKSSDRAVRKDTRKKRARALDIVTFHKEFERTIKSFAFYPDSKRILLRFGNKEATSGGLRVALTTPVQRGRLLKGFERNYGEKRLEFWDEESILTFTWESVHLYLRLKNGVWKHQEQFRTGFSRGGIWKVIPSQDGKHFSIIGNNQADPDGINSAGPTALLYSTESHAPLLGRIIPTWRKEDDRAIAGHQLKAADIFPEGWRALTNYSKTNFGHRFFYLWDGNPHKQDPVATYFIENIVESSKN